MPRSYRPAEHQEYSRDRDGHVAKQYRRLKSHAPMRGQQDTSKRAPPRLLTIQNLTDHTRYNKATDNFNIGRYLATLRAAQIADQPSSSTTAIPRDAPQIEAWRTSVLPTKPAKIEAITVDESYDSILRRNSNPAQLPVRSHIKPSSSPKRSVIESMRSRRSDHSSHMSEVYVKKEEHSPVLKPSRSRKQPDTADRKPRGRTVTESKKRREDSPQPSRKRKRVEVKHSPDRERLLKGRRDRRQAKAVIVKDRTKPTALSDKAKTAFKLEDAERRGKEAARAKNAKPSDVKRSKSSHSLHKHPNDDVSSTSLSLSTVAKSARKRLRKQSQARQDADKTDRDACRDKKKAKGFVEPLSRASNIANVPRLTVGLKRGIYKHGVASTRTDVQEKPIASTLKDLAFDERPFLNGDRDEKPERASARTKTKAVASGSSEATTRNGRREAQLTYHLPARRRRRQITQDSTSAASISVNSVEEASRRSKHEAKQKAQYTDRAQKERNKGSTHQNVAKCESQRRDRRPSPPAASTVEVSERASDTGLSAASVARRKTAKKIKRQEMHSITTTRKSQNVEASSTMASLPDDIGEMQSVDVEVARGRHDAAYIDAVTRKEVDHGPFAVAGQAYMALPRAVEQQRIEFDQPRRPAYSRTTQFVPVQEQTGSLSDTAGWLLSSPRGSEQRTYSGNDRMNIHSAPLPYKPSSDSYGIYTGRTQIAVDRGQEPDGGESLVWDLPIDDYSPGPGSPVAMDVERSEALQQVYYLPHNHYDAHQHTEVRADQLTYQSASTSGNIPRYESRQEAHLAEINVHELAGWDFAAEQWDSPPLGYEAHRYTLQNVDHNILEPAPHTYAQSALRNAYGHIANYDKELSTAIVQDMASYTDQQDAAPMSFASEQVSTRPACSSSLAEFPVFEALMDVRDVLNGQDRKQATYQGFWKKFRT